MANYQPLTKILTDENGKSHAVCVFYGTEKCLIHTREKCSICPMIEIIIAQLNVFEEVYLETNVEKIEIYLKEKG